MRISYVAHYRDGTGYGEASKGYISALLQQGVEVVAIPYRLNDRNILPPADILKAEKTKLRGIDKVVLHTLPYWFESHVDLPTIGIFSTEMSGIPTEWVNNINKLHSSIVSSNQSLECCVNSGVVKHPTVVPYCVDTTKYDKGYGKTEFIDTLKKQGKTIFYNISEFINRKNLSALLRAYYTEFSAKDDVHLIIKSNLSSVTPQTLGGIFQKKEYEIIKGLNLNEKELPGVTFLPIYMNETDIYSLHNTCDIYISASYGESWDLPLFDAMGFGKTPIYPAHTGYLNYMNKFVGYPVKSFQLPCFGLVDSDPKIYNSNFDFYSVDINDLKKKMRHAFENKKERDSISEAGIANAKLYSYDLIGPVLRKALD